jgi:hypothetical protein
MISTWAATTGAWEDSKFDRAWNGPYINPDEADLTLSTTAPTVGVEYFISVGNASLEIIQSYEWDEISEAWNEVVGSWESGMTPHVAVGTGISPAKSDLTLTGSSAPKIGIMYKFVIPLGEEQVLTGTAPGDSTGDNISPDTAELSIVQSYNWNTYGGTWANAYTDWTTAGSPYVPTALEAGQNQPDKGDLTLTGVAPSVTIQKLWYIPTQDLTLSSTAPDAPIGPSIEVGTGEMEIVQTYNWNTYGGTWADAVTTWSEDVFAPLASETQHDAIPKADLTLTGTAPTRTEALYIVPSNASLTATGYAPPFGITHFRSPGKADLTGLGTSGAWDDSSATWATISGNWSTGESIPTVGITYTFPIDSADDLILDPYGPVKVVKNPKYLPTVIVT